MLRSHAALAFAAFLALAPHDAAAQAFANERTVEGLPPAADFAFAPDGRIFVAELGGAVRIVENGVLLPAPFTRLPVNAVGERGLLGLALDPDFASNGSVYLYHSVETDPADPEGPKSGRLTRVTAQGNLAVPGSEIVLVGATAGAPSCAEAPAGSDCIPIDSVSHMGGALRFGADGMLYVGIGDGIFSNVDAVRALRAQDLDVLSGKILRIQPSDGAAPSDNPFFTGDPQANRSKVWAYGVRQPFRMAIEASSGVPLIGDVGDLSFEELSFAAPGANLGWPCFEATAISSRVGGEPLCQALYAAPPANLRFPAYAYPHVGSASVTAGVFAPAGAYPASIAGRFVFGDYPQGEVRLLTFAPSGPPVPSLGAQIAAPVDFEVGPDGRIYVLSIADGTIHRLVERELDVAPFAAAAASPIAGPTPLDVTFSSEGSFDSNGDAIRYAWDFGDGATSELANPTHRYETAGTWHATLTVRDPGGASDVATVTVLAGREAPVVSIAGPADGAIYAAGETLAFRATASDADDGPLPPASLQWVALLVHCEDMGGVFDCHVHPLTASSGGALDLVAPDHGTPDPNEFYLVEGRASAVDSDGLRTEVRVRVGPDTDGDGCMDLFAPLALASAPYQAFSDEIETPLGASLASASHEATPSGVLSTTAIAATPPGGAASAVAFTGLRGPLAIDEAGTHAIYFDAFVGGIAGIQPGPPGVAARLLGQARVVDPASGATLASRDLFSYALARNVAGPVERLPIAMPNARLPFVTRLAAGALEWRFLTTATASAASDATSTNFAVTAASVTLRTAHVCRQRVPDTTLP